MDGVITFTPAEAVSVIIGICTAIVTISASIGVIAKLLEKAKAPEATQNARLDNMEKQIDEIRDTLNRYQGYFANDDARFKSIEKSNKITQTALLALLKHNLSGSDLEALKEAEKSLEEYLIEK